MIEVAGFREVNAGFPAYLNKSMEQAFRIRVLFAVAVSLFALFGCTSSRQNPATIQAQEVSAVQRATAKYHRTIKNIAIKGTTLVVFVDDQDWDVLDTDVQDSIPRLSLERVGEDVADASPASQSHPARFYHGIFRRPVGERIDHAIGSPERIA